MRFKGLLCLVRPRFPEGGARGLTASPDALLANVHVQLQPLNKVLFAEGEWSRFVENWLDKPGDGIVEKTRKIHDDYIHDFIFDDGRLQNIYSPPFSPYRRSNAATGSGGLNR